MVINLVLITLCIDINVKIRVQYKVANFHLLEKLFSFNYPTHSYSVPVDLGLGAHFIKGF